MGNDQTATSHPEVMRRNNVTITGNVDASETMVFVHGFGTNQDAWRHVRKGFPEYRQILMDNVGAAASNLDSYRPRRYEQLEAYAEDLVEVCETCAVAGAICVGHSVGGMVSLLAALRRPRLFSKLVFIGASPRYLNEGNYEGGFDKEALQQLYAAMEGQYHRWVAGFAPAVAGAPEGSPAATEFARTLGQIRPDIALHVARAIFESDHRDRLKELVTPTLIIQTKKDIAVPIAVGEYLRDHLPNAQLTVINAEGHLPHLTAPRQIVAAIEPFIGRR